jgi:SpoVK/Ycf46/Vps4 family AAA+-type ATPase
MATAEQLKALVESFSNGDTGRFRAIAMQVAAKAAKEGKVRLAADLRDLLDRAHAPGPQQVVPIARPPRDLSGFVSASYPETRLSEMVLSDEVRGSLERVVHEYRQRERLRAYGLQPKQRLLLVGPPGCGKTMTAAALAAECRLPLMAVQLHSLVTKYLGETASKLHAIFEAMQKTPGVYLFDEFDAVGAVRSADNDVGEMRRVLNSFLQFLELTRSDSLVVAATNLLSLLDEALFRRFDAVLLYELPQGEQVRELVENRLSRFHVGGVDWTHVQQAAAGLSHADIVAAAEESAKDAVLEGHDIISGEHLAVELLKRKTFRPATRDVR